MITESDVLAFFDAKCRELSERSGDAYACISISRVGRKNGSVSGNWSAYIENGISASNPVLGIAIAECFRAVDPQVRAEEMRKQAAQLLADAEKLAPSLCS